MISPLIQEFGNICTKYLQIVQIVFTTIHKLKVCQMKFQFPCDGKPNILKAKFGYGGVIPSLEVEFWK